jgi:hypothetical protein
MRTGFSSIIDQRGSHMLIAQAVVEGGLLDTVVAAVRSGVEQFSYYIGTGNTKWVLIGLAVIMAIVLFKPKR